MPRKSRFPYSDAILVEGQSCSPAKVIQLLGPQLTDHRKERIEQVLLSRTYTVTPVLEGIYDRGNISAVLRSAEAFGLQSAHVVEVSEKFKNANRVSKGAEKWLDVFPWKSTGACVQDLRDKGYKIFATSLENAQPIWDIDFTQPAAIVFGNEKDGVSQEMLEAADGRIQVPMVGFVQSFNISVAAALCFQQIFQNRKQTQGFHGDLNEQEKQVLRALFYLRTQPSGEKQLAATL